MYQWLNNAETKKLVAAFPEGSLRFVGGAVRDSLLGKPVVDIDAATTLTPDTTMAALAKAGLKAIPTGLAHGTVTAVVDGKPFEVTTLRNDIATDGRHAKVVFTDDWKEDAKRRDFTMNALYLSPAGELTDFFAGEADAKAGRVRFIGEAGARIQEDYLRILRFFRFYAHYGKDAPDAAALAACAEFADEIDTLSGERIQKEMLKLLSAPAASHALSFMPPEIIRRTFGFTLHHIEDVETMEVIEQELKRVPDPLLRLALLLPSPAALSHLASKWRLSNEMQKTLQELKLYAPSFAAGSNVSEQKKRIRLLGNATFKNLLLVRWAQEPEHAEQWRAMMLFAEGWQAPHFPVGGDDLIAKGYVPGKEIGELLVMLERAWEASDYTLGKEALLKEIKK